MENGKKKDVASLSGAEDEEVVLSTQEIHQALEKRMGGKIPYKHLQTLMECFGKEITDTKLESFLRYAWE